MYWRCVGCPIASSQGISVLPENLAAAQLRFDDGELPQEWMDWWAAQVASSKHEMGPH